MMSSLLLWSHALAARTMNPPQSQPRQVAMSAGEDQQTLHNVTVNFDNEPVETDGNPWFRYKSTKLRGSATHDDFGGMTSSGAFNTDLVKAHNAVRGKFGLQPISWSMALRRKDV